MDLEESPKSESLRLLGQVPDCLISTLLLRGHSGVGRAGFRNSAAARRPQVYLSRGSCSASATSIHAPETSCCHSVRKIFLWLLYEGRQLLSFWPYLPQLLKSSGCFPLPQDYSSLDVQFVMPSQVATCLRLARQFSANPSKVLYALKEDVIQLVHTRC